MSGATRRMPNDPTYNPRLAPALSRGKHRSGATALPPAAPAPACALSDVPDFRRQVEAAQERARERRSEREQPYEIDRAKLKFAPTGSPEPRRAGTRREIAHELPAPPELRERTPQSERAWSTLARHAATAAQSAEEPNGKMPRRR